MKQPQIITLQFSDLNYIFFLARQCNSECLLLVLALAFACED